MSTLPFLARLVSRIRIASPVRPAVLAQNVAGTCVNLDVVTEEKSKNVNSDKKTEETTPPTDAVMNYLQGALAGWIPDTNQTHVQTQTSNPSTSEQSEIVPTSVKKPAISSVASISRRSLDDRTHGLVKKLCLASSGSSRLLRTEELCHHLIEFPETRSLAVKDGIIGLLIRLTRQTSDEGLKAQIRQCLSLVGYVSPPRGKGIRVLSIDGGGSRGIMALEILEALESQLQGRKIFEVFDMFVGVSTGAIIGALLFARKLDVHQSKELYRKISHKLFLGSGRFSGVRGLITSHSYYDSESWQNVLKDEVGLYPIIETARQPGTPKMCILSSVITQQRKLAPFAFRNYNLPSARDSFYAGSCKEPLWKAIQASSAAPLYLSEVKIDNYVHQDGGVLLNNPAAIGLHEANLLWPNTHLQCLLSLGNGRTVQIPNNDPEPVTNTSLHEKINLFVESATDTEIHHMILHDTLSPQVYFRLNPYMSQEFTLDTGEPEKLDQMQQDAQMYVRKNELKLNSLAKALLQGRTLTQKIGDCVRHRVAQFTSFNLNAI